jgi:deoxyribose-phosphate aldolase
MIRMSSLMSSGVSETSAAVNCDIGFPSGRRACVQSRSTPDLASPPGSHLFLSSEMIEAEQICLRVSETSAAVNCDIGFPSGRRATAAAAAPGTLAPPETFVRSEPINA